MGAQASTTVLAREDAARILRENVGFEDPEAWIDFAVRHRFQRVDAVVIRECPACGAGDGAIKGQYVY